VSPFIDVLLVLVIWVSLMGLSVWRPRVIYTQVDDGLIEPDRLRDTLTIVAGRAETILYGGRPVPLSEMRGRAVIVRADSDARYQDVVHAVDVARGAGARAVGLSRR
jgi:biopolymer transport protein ExbD